MVVIIAEEFIGPESWHGTTGGTSNHKCKCLACRKVWTAYCLRRRKERAEQIKPDDPRHGKPSFYLNHSCRCDKCRRAHTNATYAQRARRIAAKEAAK